MCLEEVVSKIVEERYDTKRDNAIVLLPPAVQHSKIEAEVEAEVLLLAQRIQHAVSLLEPLDLKPFKNLGIINWGLSSWDETKTYKEIAGIPETSMRQVRTLAVKNYNDGNYKDAADIFFLLSLIDWKLPYHWNSLGHAEYYSKNYRDALKAYKAASLLDIKDPKPLLHSAHCYEKLGDTKIAIDLLLEALPLTSDPFYYDYEVPIKNLLNHLRSEYDKD